MKRFLLLAFLFSLTTIYAQNTKLTEGQEALIQSTLQEAQKKGIEQWEVEKLKEGLYKKYTGHSSQKAGPLTINSYCGYADFETGNYNGWNLTSGDVNGVSLPCNTCASNPGGIANMTSHSNTGPTWINGIDHCSGLPAVAPGNGNYSLALNDNTAGGKIMRMKYVFQVDSTSAHFTFRYLAVLQDGGASHAVSDQAYFMYSFLDSTNALISSTYYTANLMSTQSDWTFDSQYASYYKGWVNDCIDLTSYIGHYVTLDVVISDCNQGGHYGYVYMDGSCLPVSSITKVNMCSDANAQQIIAQSGYSYYQWYGPNNSSLAIPAPNGTNDTLNIVNGQPGDVYYLQDSTASAHGCYQADSVTLPTITPISVNYSGSQTGTISDTATIHLCQGDTLILSAGGVITYTWSTGVTNGLAFYPTASDTYTLSGTSGSNCLGQIIIHTDVQSCGAGINKASFGNELSIYPNPSRGNINVRSKMPIEEIRISDITGRIVYVAKPELPSATIQLESEGLYFVQVRSGGKLSNTKVVIRK